ncbi:PALB2 protein, partial [Amia calva]|nr:PALB2 protein [Amia calva]
MVETGMLTQTMGGEEKRGGGERRAVTESLSFSCPNVAEDQGLLLPGAEVLGSATFLCPAPVENRWRTAVETQERLAGEGESPAVKTAWKDLPDPRDKPPGLNTGLPPGDLESGVAGTRLAAQVHSPLILNLTPASTQSVETPAPASWGSPAFPSLGLTPALPLPPSIPSLVASPSHPLRPKGSPQLLPLFRKRCRESSQTTQMEPQLAGLLERPQTEDRPPLPDETVEHFPDTFPLSLPLSPLIHPSPLPQVAECPPNSQQPTRCPSQTPSADSVQLSGGRESALKDGVDATPRVHCTLSGKPFLGQSALGMLSPLPPIPLSSTPQHLLSQAESNTPPGSQDREENGDPDRERSPLPQTAQSLTAHPPSQPSLPPQSPGEKPLLLPSADVLQLSLGVEEDLDSYFSDSMWTGVPGTQPPAPNKVTSPELSPRARQSPSACTAKDPVSAPSPASPKSPLPHPASLQLVHTLKAPAGPCLVDVCSVCCRGEDGALRECVVTAGEWAVSVWGPKVQGWSLLHTWTFTEHPVIGLEMLPDSPGLLCVTLGQLEIREARVLGCVSVDGPFSHTLLCAGKVQAVLGVSGCRVACCSQSESRQAVDLMRLSEEGRTEDTFSLASPGQSVRALAVVDGQKDALIGCTDSSDVLLWNMRTSHLLQRISLGLSYPGSMCLRGYSQSGVLFLLLQCVFVSTLDGEEGALFSLVATNPVTAKTSLAHSLSQPAQCPGRLVHGDVRGDAVAAVFQSGAVAVWAVGDSRVVTTLLPGPVGGWHLARWGGPCSLLAGQLNGDVSLYHYSLPEP